jgi:hypothetical protein
MSDKTARSPKNVDQTLSPAVVRMLAIGCAVTVANLWYAQPLLATMATEWHVSQQTMGTWCVVAGLVRAVFTDIKYDSNLFTA